MIDFKLLDSYSYIESHNYDGKSSYYGIFFNSKGESLIYFPVPKNANTSIKLFLLDHFVLKNDFNIYFDKNHHDYTDDENKIIRNFYDFIPLKQRYAPIPKNQSLIRLALIRDPIERFISSYKNRILFHKDKYFKGLSIDEILNILEEGYFANTHFLPQSYFLGQNPKNFDLIEDVKNLKKIEKKVNDFFGLKKVIPRFQTGGNDIKIELTKQQIDRIKKIYSVDFKLFDKI